MRTRSTVEKAIDVPFVLTGKQEGPQLTEIRVCLALKKKGLHQFLASLRKKFTLAGVGNGPALKIPCSQIGSQREK